MSLHPRFAARSISEHLLVDSPLWFFFLSTYWYKSLTFSRFPLEWLQGFFVQALLLCLFTCLVSIGYHVLVSLSRDVESKRQQHFERVRNGEFEMQPPPQAPPHYNIAQQWGPHYGQPPSYMQQQQPPIYYAHYNPQYSQQPGFAQGQAVNYHK